MFSIYDRVKETSTSVGPGDFILTGAITGYKTFASRCAINDRCYYCVQSVDASGAPSGEWETGIGVYVAANTISREVVFESSNADGLVNFLAGTKQVFMTLPAMQFKGGVPAEVISTGIVDIYVRKDGSDSNTGLVNSDSGALLTIQGAFDRAGTYDYGNVYIHIGDGVYTESVYCPDARTTRSIYAEGNRTTPGAVVINGGSNGIYLSGNSSLGCVTATSEAISTITGFGLGQYSQYVNDVIFGENTAGGHVRVTEGGNVTLGGTITINGGAQYLLSVEGRSQARLDGAVVINGTPTMSSAFLMAKEQSLISTYPLGGNVVTITGGVIGKKYDIRHNSVIYDPQAVTLPGTVAGTTATGGQYSTT